MKKILSPLIDVILHFKKLRVIGIEILIPEPEVGIDHNWVAGFGFLEVGFDRNLEFGFQW